MSELIELSHGEIHAVQRQISPLLSSIAYVGYVDADALDRVVYGFIGAVNAQRKGALPATEREPREVRELGVSERGCVWIDRVGDEWRWSESDETWHWRWARDEEWLQPMDYWVVDGILSARFGPFREAIVS